MTHSVRTLHRNTSIRTTDMTEGKPLRLILTFALPLMVGNIFQQLYTVVDTAVVGQVLGVNALAALGAADWTYWMVLGIIQGLSQGFAIRMAQEFGAKQYKSLGKTIGNSIFLSIVLAILMVIGSLLAAFPLLLLLQTPDTILPMTLSYLRILFAGIPIVMAYNVLASVLRSLGDKQSPLYAMIIASLINVALDLLFVAVFRWGIPGAAGATLIAQLCSGLYCLKSLTRIDILALTKEDIHPDKELDICLLKLGLPMAFQNAIIAVGGMILQFVVNGFGVLFIAGFTATNKLYGVLEIAAVSYGYSMVTYVGQNLGAGKISRIIKGMRTAIIAAIVTAAVIGIFMLIFGKTILLLFISGDANDVATTLEIAYHYLAIMSIFLPVLYILHVTRSSLQGMGDTVLPMVSGFAEFFMRTGAAFTLPSLLGEEGIFFAEILAWSGADVVLIISCLYRIRNLKRTLNSSEAPS